MKINYERIFELTGCQFETAEDLLFYMQRHLNYLGTHNKNLTNKQYHIVCDIENFLDCIEA